MKVMSANSDFYYYGVCKTSRETTLRALTQDRPRSELTELELQQLEEFEFAHGPMSLLQHSVSTNTPVVISCRNNHKLVARVKAFDRHCNMVLESVKELWSEPVRNAKGKVIKTVSRERFVSKMFLRGDSVVIVVKT